MMPLRLMYVGPFFSIIIIIIIRAFGCMKVFCLFQLGALDQLCVNVFYVVTFYP